MTFEDAANLILAERKRQVEIEGQTEKRIDEYVDGEMMQAALVRLKWDGKTASPKREVSSNAISENGAGVEAVIGCPWAALRKKLKVRLSNLVSAGALFIAERDRLSRAKRCRAHVDEKLDLVIRELEAIEIM